MNRQEMICRLRQYRSLHVECQRLRQRIKDKRDCMYDVRAVAMKCTNIRSGDISDRVERVVEMVDEAVDYYVRKLAEAEAAERGIAGLIDSISDSEERAVLFMHYIEGRTLSDIGQELYLSERTIWSRHNAAIEKLCRQSADNL